MIWAELLSRHGQVTARYRCAGPTVRIGRSYRNDVVLDDMAAAPEHLRIVQGEDGRIAIEALGDGTTFTIAGTAHRQSTIDGDTVIQIGRTLLRFRDENYPVPASIVPARGPIPWVSLALLVVATLGLFALDLWLTETAEARASRYVATLAGLVLVALVWGALWALVSRIFSGFARFPLHLALGFAALLTYALGSMIALDLAFALSWPALATYLPLSLWVLLGLLCFLHLQAIAPTRAVLKACILIALIAIGVAVQLANQFDPSRAGQQPVIAHTVLPPAFRLAHVKTEDQFFADVTDLKKKLDADHSPTSAP